MIGLPGGSSKFFKHLALYCKSRLTGLAGISLRCNNALVDGLLIGLNRSRCNILIKQPAAASGAPARLHSRLWKSRAKKVEIDGVTWVFRIRYCRPAPRKPSALIKGRIPLEGKMALAL